MKKISIDTMNKRLKERFPNDNIEFVFYEAVSKPCKIKCLKCGRINSHKDADSFFRTRRKKYYCSNCNDTNEWKKQKNVFLNWLEVHADEFELIDSLDEIHDSQSHVKCRCTKCGLIQENKTIYDYYNGKKCYCTAKGSKKPEIILNKQLEENGFLLLETYINTDTPIRAKRIACGHEFIGRPHRMFSDKNYCPLCHTYKGEEEIKSILNSKNIKYITQHKIFTYKKCFVDFFLPEFNVFIEFNGIQHFEPVEHFGGEKAFKEQLKRDKAVRIYCKENNIKLLEISYKEIDKISFILRGCLGYEE